ncbi:B3 domain-containing protein LFL1-like [Phalaenopsis equestris]|uniref:B3 domain-containing protein LFL1-like n=1 Tax=Phalaenopsis equestris TaxID=78828 RepID=UPI0009E558CF|nr:B3 domain-containing protein LFL1-like [Phalaenopsis equestris]
MAGIPSGAASPDLRSEAGFAARRRKRTFSARPPPASAYHLRRLPLQQNLLPLQPAMTGLRFLLQKELRNSDVGSLGRIVLPKKESEANLPILTAREGISLPMTDSETARVWRFKFRFWPNNKSRMYILENTGEFVRSHGLKSGDFIMLYRDDGKDRYVIRAKKAGTSEPALASLPVMEDGIFDSIVADIVVARARYSDLYLPLADGMNMSFGLNFAFSADLVMSFGDDKVENNSAESAHKLGSMESLSLDDLY